MIGRRVKSNRRRSAPSRSHERMGHHVRALWLLAVLAAGVVGLWYGANRVTPGLLRWADQFFEIRDVEIPNGLRVSREEVLALLDLTPGRGLIVADPKQMEQAVATHPWIRRVQIRRVFPHALVVDLEERVPAAVLRTGGRDFLLDKEGLLIVAGSSQADQGLPALTGVDYVGAVFGDAETLARVRSGITLAGLLEQAGAGRTEVDLRTPGDMVAYYSKFRVRFGDGPFEDKVDRYRRVSDRVFDRWGGAESVPVRRGVEVDLRFQDRIIVRERG